MLTEYLSAHLAQLQDMRYDENGLVHMEFKIPTRGLIGFNAFFLRTTRGDGVKTAPSPPTSRWKARYAPTEAGVLVASEAGVAVTYGLLNAQGRGDTFIDAGAKVYEGMIIGSQRRGGDIPSTSARKRNRPTYGRRRPTLPRASRNSAHEP